jgi:DNA polymerase III subunit alpha
MQAGMVDDFIDRKHGRKKVEYPHPTLREVLEPTYGTIVYQEQVMQCAQVLAGYTLGSADLLRRAMGKKKFEEMAKQRETFCSGAAARGIDAHQASSIFDTIEKFAGYGFNKSHSAAYALITYQTAYLKAHYPIEFMAALLTTESGSTDNVVKYIHESRSHGIEVLPPSLNISAQSFTVDYRVPDEMRRRRKQRNTAYGRIRFGLGAIKGLGDAAIETIIACRHQDGSFTSLYDFAERIAQQEKLNRKTVEVLVKSGAFDETGRPRAQLSATIDRAIDCAQSSKRDSQSGQTSMFALFAEASPKSARQETYADVVEWPESEKLAFEREALGLYLSGHPLDRFVDDAKQMNAIPTVELLQARHNSEVKVVGIVAGLRERIMKTGDGRWAVVTLEDTFGQAEVLCFSRVYGECEALLKAGEPLVVHGRALIDDINDEGQQLVPKMRAESIQSLAAAQMARTRILEVSIDVPSLVAALDVPEGFRFDPRTQDHLDKDRADGAKANAMLDEIHRACLRHPGEKPLRMKIVMPAAYQNEIPGTDVKVSPSESLIHELLSIRGVASVQRR